MSGDWDEWKEIGEAEFAGDLFGTWEDMTKRLIKYLPQYTAEFRALLKFTAQDDWRPWLSASRLFREKVRKDLSEQLAPIASRLRARGPAGALSEDAQFQQATGRSESEFSRDLEFANRSQTPSREPSATPEGPARNDFVDRRSTSRLRDDLPGWQPPDNFEEPLSRAASPELRPERAFSPPMFEDVESGSVDDRFMRAPGRSQRDRDLSQFFPRPPGGFNDRGFSEATQAINERFERMVDPEETPILPARESPPPTPKRPDPVSPDEIKKAVLQFKGDQGTGLGTTMVVAFVFLVAANYLD